MYQISGNHDVGNQEKEKSVQEDESFPVILTKECNNRWLEEVTLIKINKQVDEFKQGRKKYHKKTDILI